MLNYNIYKFAKVNDIQVYRFTNNAWYSCVKIRTLNRLIVPVRMLLSMLHTLDNWYCILTYNSWIYQVFGLLLYLWILWFCIFQKSNLYMFFKVTNYLLRNFIMNNFDNNKIYIWLLMSYLKYCKNLLVL